MSLAINTNLAGLTALTSLDQADQSLQTSIQRLSSGLKVSTPGDGAAAYVTSQGLRAQISGIAQASQNTQSAINLAKMAGGAMGQIESLLQSMRTLAVTSANAATADPDALQANQTQLQTLLSSIDQIASTTQFGNQLLLSGTAGVQASITDSSDVSSLFIGENFGGAQVRSGPVTVQNVTPATAASITTTRLFSATATMASSGVLVLNGTAVQVNQGESIQNVVSSFNALATQTGVTAQLVPSGGQFSVEFNQSTDGSQYSASLVDASNILNSASSVTASGTDGVFDVSATTASGVQTVAFTGGKSLGSTGLQLSDSAGNTLTITDGGNSGLATPTQVGVITAGSVQFQVGPNPTQVATYSLPSMASSSIGVGAVAGQSVASLNIGSPAGATIALQVLDAAITQVATAQGQLGSFQAQVLQTAASSLDVATQNDTAAVSTIADADVAAESTTYTKNQVLEQSGLAILAQANQDPAELVALLKNI